MNDYVIRGHAGLPSRMETSPGTPLRTMNPRDVDYVIQMTAPGDRVLFLTMGREGARARLSKVVFRAGPAPHPYTTKVIDEIS